MPDPKLNQSNAVEDVLENFREKLFATKADKNSFDRLCARGCAKDELTGWILLASIAPIARQEPVLEVGHLTRARLKQVIRDIDRVRDLIAEVNKTQFNPKFDLLWAPQNPERDGIRKTLANHYEHLPIMLQIYTVHLESWYDFCRSNLRRITIPQHIVLKFLRYIELEAGSPCYEDVASLLQAGFSAVGSKEPLPEFFTSEALSKLKQRFSRLRRERTRVASPRPPQS